MKGEVFCKLRIEVVVVVRNKKEVFEKVFDLVVVNGILDKLVKWRYF